jgi:hypothetical protein
MSFAHFRKKTSPTPPSLFKLRGCSRNERDGDGDDGGIKYKINKNENPH